MSKLIANDDTPMERAFAILDYVIENGRPVAIADAALALGLPVPTAHRLAVQLEERGYLRRAVGSKRFVMGSRLRELGFKVVEASFQEAPQHALLQSLADEVGELCELGMISGKEVIYIDGARPAQPASLLFEPSRRSPIHCTSTGKLFLSRLPEEGRRQFIDTLTLTRCTSHTITDGQELIRELDVVRERGWATNNEEYVIGVVGCAVPVLGQHKSMVAGLGISIPAARMAFEDLPKYLPVLQKAAADLSRLLESER